MLQLKLSTTLILPPGPLGVVGGGYKLIIMSNSGKIMMELVSGFDNRKLIRNVHMT